MKGWNFFEKPSFVLRYGIGLLISVISLWLMHEFSLGTGTPFLLFFLAVALSAYYGGLGPGILATFVTTIFGNFYFVPPFSAFAFSPQAIWVTSVFFTENILLTLLVDKQRKTNKALYEEREKYNVTLSSIGDAVIATDTDGNITFMNPVAEKLTGWKNSEAIGKKLENIFKIINEDSREVVDNPVTKVLKKGIIVGLANHTVLVTKDNKEIAIDDSGAPIKDHKGNLIGVVLTFRDVSEKREFEKKKDDFLNITSHELKTPVTSLKVYSQTLKKIALKNGHTQYDKYLAKIGEQAIKMTGLITSLLDIARMDAGKMQYNFSDFNINHTLEEIIEVFNETNGTHKIELHSQVIKKAYGDENRISQVVNNFITNSIKYSPNADKIIVSAIEKDSQLIVSVQDFGIGIDKKNLNRVFERFFRVTDSSEKTYPGLGIGLYVSAEIMKRHKGKIWVESEKGKGSVFYFSFPHK